MGVSTHDMFGDAAGAQPASPGSYGEAPRGYRLPEGTHVGGVRLQVADLPRSIAYYGQTLGMRVLRRDGFPCGGCHSLRAQPWGSLPGLGREVALN